MYLLFHFFCGSSKLRRCLACGVVRLCLTEESGATYAVFTVLFPTLTKIRERKGLYLGK